MFILSNPLRKKQKDGHRFHENDTITYIMSSDPAVLTLEYQDYQHFQNDLKTLKLL